MVTSAATVVTVKSTGYLGIVDADEATINRLIRALTPIFPEIADRLRSTHNSDRATFPLARLTDVTSVASSLGLTIRHRSLS